MKNFVALVGSESSTSTNRHLLQYMKTHFSEEATIELISLTNLPIFKKTADRFMPEPALALIKKFCQQTVSSLVRQNMIMLFRHYYSMR